MSTGDELVEVGRTPGRGQIPDSNRWALLAALREAGADVDVLGIAPDEAEPLRRLVVDALKEADALVTSGGVSVGTHDLVKPLLESLGTVHVGRVKLKPGKPFTFATLADHRVAFGLPGFPVSSLVTFEVFVRPALRKMQGFAQLHRPTLPVRLGYDARPTADRTEYQRVTLRRDGLELIAETTGSQSSSRLMSLAGAHALVKVPAGDQGIIAGSIVEAMILSLGVDTRRYTLMAFAIGAGLGGVSGALYAPLTQFVDPTPFALGLSPHPSSPPGTSRRRSRSLSKASVPACLSRSLPV